MSEIEDIKQNESLLTELKILIDKLADANTFHQLDSFLSSFSLQSKELIVVELENITKGINSILGNLRSTNLFLRYLDAPLGVNIQELDAINNPAGKSNLLTILLKYNIFFNGMFIGRPNEWRTVMIKSSIQIQSNELLFNIEIAKMSNEIIKFESALPRMIPLVDYIVKNIGIAIQNISQGDKRSLQYSINTLQNLSEEIDKIVTHMKKISKE